MLSYSLTVNQYVTTFFFNISYRVETKISERGFFFLIFQSRVVGLSQNYPYFYLSTIFMKFGTLFPKIIDISWYIWYEIKISDSGSLFFPCGKREGGSGNLKIIIIFLTVWYLYNLEHCFLVSLYGDSIGLKSKFQKMAPFFLVRHGKGQSKNYFLFTVRFL